VITIEEAREWIATHVPTAAHSVSTGLETAGQTLRLYLTAAIASAGPHWREIAAAIVVVLVAGGIMSVLHAQRRRELLEQSLVEAKLGHDPKTDWLELQIVMRNRQTRALLVHSIQVMDPPGTKICERWQAWRADGNGGGVKFVAPDLELSDSVAIERTIRPSEADDFAEATDELVRHFYVRLQKSWFRRRTSLEARLICELRTRGGLRQELVFKRAAAEALAAQQAQ
jgi:hypothetical protein